jgi:hypothetical protein
MLLTYCNSDRSTISRVTSFAVHSSQVCWNLLAFSASMRPLTFNTTAASSFVDSIVIVRGSAILGNPLLLHYRNMDFSEADVEKLRPRLRFKVCYRVGFACPDVDDIVQETLTRFLSIDPARPQNADATGAYLGSRANERFRNIYVSKVKRRGASSHK